MKWYCTSKTLFNVRGLPSVIGGFNTKEDATLEDYHPPFQAVDGYLETILHPIALISNYKGNEIELWSDGYQRLLKE